MQSQERIYDFDFNANSCFVVFYSKAGSIKTMAVKESIDRVDLFRKGVKKFHNANVRDAYGIGGEADEATVTTKQLRELFEIDEQDALPLITAKITAFYLVTSRSPAMASVPLQWSIQRQLYQPQLVVKSRPVTRKNRARKDSRGQTYFAYDGNRQLVVPHFDFAKIDSIDIPDYKIGRHCATFVLKDKSTIIVYCATRAEAVRLCENLAGYVKNEMLPPGEIKENITYSLRRKPLKSDGVNMRPYQADYYEFGNEHHPETFIKNLTRK
jgi:hypothetical protein